MRNYSYSIVTLLATDKTTTQKDTIEPHVGQADADKVEAGRRELTEAIDDQQFVKILKCILICLALILIMIMIALIVLVVVRPLKSFIPDVCFSMHF